MRTSLIIARPDLIKRLLPSVNDVRIESISNLPEDELFDKSIYKNKEQLQAVSHIAAGSSNQFPYILFGPPGTGKTVTFVEAVKQVYKRMNASTIIVTAQSNTATDLLAQKLVNDIPHCNFAILNLLFQLTKQNLNLGDIVRIYSFLHEDSYDVPSSLLKIHRFGFDWLLEEKLNQRIICLTLSMTNNLVHYPSNNISFAKFIIDDL